MEIKINKALVVVIVLGALIGCFFIGKAVSGIQHRIDSENLANQLNIALNDTVRHYEVIIDGLKKDVAQKTELVLSKQEALDAELISKERYKKLYLKSIEHNTSIDAYVQILLDSIGSLDDPDIYFITDEDSLPCARLPYQWDYKDEWVIAQGLLNEKAETSLELSMPVDIEVILGKKKGGIPTVSIIEDNPYFFVMNIKSVKIEDKKWWESPWIKYGLGVATGVGVMVLAK
jgi:hypothetical protein